MGHEQLLACKHKSKSSTRLFFWQHSYSNSQGTNWVEGTSTKEDNDLAEKPCSCDTCWGRNKMATILHTTFWNTFLWMKAFLAKQLTISALGQILAWRHVSSEPMLVSLPTRICVTRSQLVKYGDRATCTTMPLSIIIMMKNYTCMESYSWSLCYDPPNQMQYRLWIITA